VPQHRVLRARRLIGGQSDTADLVYDSHQAVVHPRVSDAHSVSIIHLKFYFHLDPLRFSNPTVVIYFLYVYIIDTVPDNDDVYISTFASN